MSAGRWTRCLLAAAGLVMLAGTARAEDPVEDMSVINRREAAAPKELTAVLRGVNKITARVSEIDAPIDKPVRFGSLKIVARTCTKRPPEETPEVTAFLEISEIKPDGTEQKLFSGWMFASSPALSALEHPVYDVWVIDCKTSAPAH